MSKPSPRYGLNGSSSSSALGVIKPANADAPNIPAPILPPGKPERILSPALL